MAANQNIGIAGAGRIGQAMGRLLRDRGQPVVVVAGRDPERTARAAEFIGPGVRAVRYAELPAIAGRVLVAVPDDAVEQVAEAMAQDGMRGGAALHTCGSRGPEALGPLAAQGVSCAALHPLQTVASPAQGAGALPGSAFGITGSGEAAEWAAEIVKELGGRPLFMDSARRPLYHAAAVMASNNTVALVDAAVILMREAGVPEEDALSALAPLIRASIENVLRLGPARALTGPVERGDTGTVAAHLHALADSPESVRELYRAAGLHAVQLGSRKAPGTDRREMERLLRKDLHDE